MTDVKQKKENVKMHLKDLRKDFKLENYKITEEDIKNYPDYNFKPFEKNDINDENADSSDSSEEDKNFYNGEKLVISSSSMECARAFSRATLRASGEMSTPIPLTRIPAFFSSNIDDKRSDPEPVPRSSNVKMYDSP